MTINDSLPPPASRKDRRILKMIARGIEDQRTIAKKIGFYGEAVTAGVARVNEGIARMKESGHII